MERDHVCLDVGSSGGLVGLHILVAASKKAEAVKRAGFAGGVDADNVPELKEISPSLSQGRGLEAAR